MNNIINNTTLGGKFVKNMGIPCLAGAFSSLGLGIMILVGSVIELIYRNPFEASVIPIIIVLAVLCFVFSYASYQIFAFNKNCKISINELECDDSELGIAANELIVLSNKFSKIWYIVFCVCTVFQTVSLFFSSMLSLSLWTILSGLVVGILTGIAVGTVSAFAAIGVPMWWKTLCDSFHKTGFVVIFGGMWWVAAIALVFVWYFVLLYYDIKIIVKLVKDTKRVMLLCNTH